LEGARVLVAGGPGERDLASPVLDAVAPDRRIDLVGTEPLMVLAACLERARLTVANDSGLMHLAAASGCPTLGLFGPSDDQNYAPRGLVTAWVRAEEGAGALLARFGQVGREPGALMDGLSVDTVERSARALLRSS
jgi:ADP-heptose:LPS heptosyltransferase